MILITLIKVLHEKSCKRDLPIRGDYKVYKRICEKKFNTSKDVIAYWNRLSKLLKIPRNRIDFNTIDMS